MIFHSAKEFLSRKIDLILILAVSFVAFANTLKGQFVSDDIILIVRNPHLLKLPDFTYWFTHLYMSSEQRLATNYYRPLPGLSFAADAKLWGIQPFGFHLTNLIIFAATSVIFYLLLIKLFNNKTLALVAALLFAVHPVHTEPVAWVSARPDLLCGLLLLLSMLLFATWRQTGAANMKIGSVAAFAGAMLSKEVTIMALPFLYAMTYWEEPKEKRLNLSSRFTIIIPYAAVVTLCLIARQYVLIISSGIEFAPVFDPATLTERLLGVPVNVAGYMRMLFIPRASQFYHSATKIASFANPVFWFALTAEIGILSALVIWRKRFPVIFWGALWMLALLLPATNIVQLPGQTMGERYVYIPSFGACIIAAALLVSLWRAALARTKTITATAAGVLLLSCLLVILTAISWKGNALWRDELTIWSNVVKRHPHLVHAHNGLAAAYLEKGLTQEAIVELETALKLRPQMNNVRLSLASILAEQGQVERAIHHYQEIVKRKPKTPAAYVDLARIYMEANPARNSDAIKVLEKGALELPDDTTIAYHLAYLYIQEGKNSSRVVELLVKVVKETPDAQAARLALGKAYARLGKKREAREQFEWLVAHSVDLHSLAVEEMNRLK